MKLTDDGKLQKKLSDVDDDKLIELIKEAKKIREELGDSPEIKEIKLDIAAAQTHKRKKSFVNGMKYLLSLAYVGAGLFLVSLCNISESQVVQGLRCLFLLEAIISTIKTIDYQLYGEENVVYDDIKIIKEKIKNLQLQEENKNLKARLQDTGLIEEENIEGEKHARRR